MDIKEVFVIFMIIAGISKAIVDITSHKFTESIFKNCSIFWDPDNSWKLKYKNGVKEQGERFPLSSTLLVLFTDAWHLFGYIERISLILGTFFMIKDLIHLVLYYLVFITTFHIFYHKIFKSN